ncbi:hypothetical protein EV644_105280 [Kribbella orskensis]|uniref:Uncharacterized protein n=1 Tax=Kribbella orskensis TaxID=2512216 RepID=A0ABY2BM93_9ACTN|nr:MULTISPECIES: hypothetical protein [Kribbella]TCN40995.1 hypothetical protein EV642_104280 [Kribbella sp. VKM Ac-2500]TCO24247.1 hypothetical protein EV644_105280 [Kribbella orskensis]
MTSTTLQPKEVGISAILMMADGSLADFEAVIHPVATNHEASAEPPAARGRGPAAFCATGLLAGGSLCRRFAGRSSTSSADRGLVVFHTTKSGRHVNTFVSYDETSRP